MRAFRVAPSGSGSAKLNKEIETMGMRLCKICGRPIANDCNYGGDNARMHDKCVFGDILTTLQNTGKITHVQEQRLHQRNYSLKRLKEEHRDFII